VHVSQVASRWVKNIRNYVKEGQVRAAKVLSINTARNQIDLSFTKVSSHAQRARIEEWKQLKRTKKLLEVFAKEQGKPFDLVWDEVAVPLFEAHGSLPGAFQEIALHGEEAAKNVGTAFLKPLVLLVKKNVPVPEKSLQGVLSLRSFRPDGVDVIRQALSEAEKKGGEKVSIFYTGGGKFVVRATGPDFKAAEKSLNTTAGLVVDSLKASGGEAKFERSE